MGVPKGCSAEQAAKQEHCSSIVPAHGRQLPGTREYVRARWFTQKQHFLLHRNSCDAAVNWC